MDLYIGDDGNYYDTDGNYVSPSEANSILAANPNTNIYDITGTVLYNGSDPSAVQAGGASTSVVTPSAAVPVGSPVPSTTVTSSLNALGSLLSSVGKTVSGALIASNAGTPIYNSAGQIVGYTNAAGQVVSAASLQLQGYLPIILLVFGGILVYKLLMK